MAFSIFIFIIMFCIIFILPILDKKIKGKIIKYNSKEGIVSFYMGAVMMYIFFGWSLLEEFGFIPASNNITLLGILLDISLFLFSYSLQEKRKYDLEKTHEDRKILKAIYVAGYLAATIPIIPLIVIVYCKVFDLE